MNLLLMEISRLTSPRIIPKHEEDLIRDYLYTKEGQIFPKKPLSNRLGSDHVGKPMTSLASDNRLRVGFKGKRYLTHRLVYFLHYGHWPEGVVDHINGVTTDNRPENLRDIPKGQNSRSFSKSRGGGSDYRGVVWISRLSKYSSRISYEGKLYYLGTYACEKEAALAYNYKAQELGYNPEAFNQVFEDK